jgi:hypothetical protein
MTAECSAALDCVRKNRKMGNGSLSERLSYVFGAHRAPLQKMINRVHEPQRSFVRQDLLFHLIHDVGERDFVFRIGKGMTATGARMSEGIP